MEYYYNQNSDPKRRIPIDLQYERAKLMWEERTKQHFSLGKIGKVFGLSRERVRQILNEFEAERKEHLTK